eukprot:scaffold107812_cov110-Cyclotella_meneghiniana.AAC.1
MPYSQEEAGESLPLNARHRCQVSGTRRQFTITEHFVLAWLGSIIYVVRSFMETTTTTTEALIQYLYTDSSYIRGFDGSTIERLLRDNNLHQNRRGRVLYSDNWYTTMDLAYYHLYNKYGYFFCGTMVPIDKKARQDKDVPFLKLSIGAKAKLERGWFRGAVP